MRRIVRIPDLQYQYDTRLLHMWSAYWRRVPAPRNSCSQR